MGTHLRVWLETHCAQSRCTQTHSESSPPWPSRPSEPKPHVIMRLPALALLLQASEGGEGTVRARCRSNCKLPVLHMRRVLHGAPTAGGGNNVLHAKVTRHSHAHRNVMRRQAVDVGDGGVTSVLQQLLHAAGTVVHGCNVQRRVAVVVQVVGVSASSQQARH